MVPIPPATVVSVGFLTNLLDLMLSTGDENSALDGPALVSRKVKRMVVMGGRRWPSEEVEWNFGGCGGGCGNFGLLGSITNQTFDLWPRDVPVIYLGFEAGSTVRTGLSAVRRGLPSAPCDLAYGWFCDRLEGWCEAGGRNSWDPMVLLYAVRGDTVSAEGFERPAFLSGGRGALHHLS